MASSSPESYNWWLGGAIVCERDSLQTGFPITKCYFGQGVLQTDGTGTTKLYYTLDHLGSVQELTDETGEVVADYRYSIYGEREATSSFPLLSSALHNWYYKKKGPVFH